MSTVPPSSPPPPPPPPESEKANRGERAKKPWNAPTIRRVDDSIVVTESGANPEHNEIGIYRPSS